MATKPVTIEVYVRDDEHGTTGGTPFGILNVESAQGSTDDEGVTVVIGNGYLPNVAVVAPADIKVTVHQPSVFNQPAELVSRVDDAVENTSTLTFNPSTSAALPSPRLPAAWRSRPAPPRWRWVVFARSSWPAGWSHRLRASRSPSEA